MKQNFCFHFHCTNWRLLTVTFVKLVGNAVAFGCVNLIPLGDIIKANLSALKLTKLEKKKMNTLDEILGIKIYNCSPYPTSPKLLCVYTKSGSGYTTTTKHLYLHLSGSYLMKCVLWEIHFPLCYTIKFYFIAAVAAYL